MPKIINFETPSSYQSIRQLDSDSKNQQQVKKIFSDFVEDKGQEGRKKILVLISGSYIRQDPHLSPDEQDYTTSQYYPKYLQQIAHQNPDCDFLVLNVDPDFSDDFKGTVSDIPQNISLKFLQGNINPLISQNFYSEIGNNLHNFNKVILCTHTDPAGLLYFHSLHKHCQKSEIDCLTIGAYFNNSPCCTLAQPVIAQDFIPTELFKMDNPLHKYIETANLEKSPLSKEDKDKIKSITDFVIEYSFAEQDKSRKRQALARAKTHEGSGPVKHFEGIHDSDFKNEISNFISNKKVKNQNNHEILALIGVNIGFGVGALTVTTLGLGFVPLPAIGVVAGFSIAGGLAGVTASKLINPSPELEK